jgi:hypothetical protein
MRITSNVYGLVAPRHGLMPAKGTSLVSDEVDQKAKGIAPAGDSKAKRSDGNDTGGAGARTATNAAQQARHEVDRRISDGGTMKVTVISYSDGSHDTLQEIKGAALDKSALTPATDRPAAGETLSKAILFGGKGMMIDRSA